MGRKPWSTRLTIEDCWYGLAAERLQRGGVFRSAPGTIWTTSYNDANGVILAVLAYYVKELPSGGLALVVDPELGYTAPARLKLPGKHVIPITSTSPHLGGKRYWFRCPILHEGRPCGRRVGRLYLPPEQKIFGCRSCFDLTYRSAQQHVKRKDALARDPEALFTLLKALRPL